MEGEASETEISDEEPLSDPLGFEAGHNPFHPRTMMPPSLVWRMRRRAIHELRGMGVLGSSLSLNGMFMHWWSGELGFSPPEYR